VGQAGDTEAYVYFARARGRFRSALQAGPHANAVQDDPALILDLKEEIREECEKLGEITNVVLYDKEEDGVVTVRFQDIHGAAACVKVCNQPDAVRRFIADSSML
jgi:hypothetical protein